MTRLLARVLLVETLVAALFAGSMGLVTAATPNVGQHLHWEVLNHPVDGFPIPKAPYTFHIHAQTHAETAATRWFRLDDYDHAGPQVPLKLGPGNASATFDYTVDFSKWATGRHELRWHLDLSPNNDGKRQYTTSRTQICVGSCSPNLSGRATPFNGGGSWYDKYATAYVLSADTDIRPGGSIKVRADQDARSICVLANPDIHNGSSGTRLGCWNDTANHTVSLAGRTVGDKLLVLAYDAAGNVGVIRLIVGDGSRRAVTDVEVQAWWAKGGLVLP